MGCVYLIEQLSTDLYYQHLPKAHTITGDPKTYWDRAFQGYCVRYSLMTNQNKNHEAKLDEASQSSWKRFQQYKKNYPGLQY